MIFTQPNEEMRAQIEDAIKIVDEHHHRSSPGWSERYGHAFAFLFQILERDLKEWVKANPPGHADYDKSTPMRAVYLYADQIHPNFRTVHDVLLTNRIFEKIVIKALQSVKSSSRKSEKDIVAGKYPEYLDLLKEIRDTKRRWNAEDAAIRKTESFRMMGGLARMGSHAGSAYSRLVEKAQSMEQSVLGKTLTKHHRAS